MYEWQTYFSSLTTFVLGTDGVYFVAITLLSVILAARMLPRKNGGLLQGLSEQPLFVSKGTQRHQAALSALKTCPKCADQLPLATLVCDGCEYNFLSGTVGSRHKMLPAPNAAAANG